MGQVAFSPVYAANQKSCLGYILAPLAVKPKYHNTGIGSKLVEGGIARISEMGINLFVVYGDPRYYGKFGFKAEAGFKVCAALRVEISVWVTCNSTEPGRC